jgi:aminoglycoside phosphotransferase (APT) family kinase protein
MAGDTMPVRDDERFDEAALAAYLEGRLEGAGRPLTVRQFGGGAANLTYELDFGSAVYVLRRPPLGPVAPKSHDMAREYQVLAAIAEVYPYSPRPYLLCADDEVIGAPFFIMERKRGTVIHRELPPALAQDPEMPAKLAYALVEALAALHDIDYAGVGLSDLGKPEGFVERQVHGWWNRWEAARAAELPSMRATYDWLAANLPARSEGTIVHNDFKLNNCMFDDQGRLVAVFDWDMATLGDPLCDLGTLLAYWVEDDDPPEMKAFTPMPPDAGWPTRAELVARYARLGGEVEEIGFYHTLGLFRLAVILAQIYIRWEREQTQDERFSRFWELTKSVAAAAANEIP